MCFEYPAQRRRRRQELLHTAFATQAGPEAKPIRRYTGRPDSQEQDLRFRKLARVAANLRHHLRFDRADSGGDPGRLFRPAPETGPHRSRNGNPDRQGVPVSWKYHPHQPLFETLIVDRSTDSRAQRARSRTSQQLHFHPGGNR